MAANLIYLASGSPRRRELLDQIGVQYQVLAVEIDEAVKTGESPAAYTLRLAEEKARAGLRHLVKDPSGGAGAAVLSADTAVVLDGQIMGKPRDRQEAFGMLRLLSGRTHQVLTAVALATPQSVATRLSTSDVTFRTVDAEEARAYWDTGEPRDKAGGYAIQGRAAMFIAHLQGSYSGVMGLPLFETAQLLAAHRASGGRS